MEAGLLWFECGCLRAGLEEALEADAVEGGDEEAGRLRGLLSALGQGVPAPGGREDSERQRCGMGPACVARRDRVEIDKRP